MAIITSRNVGKSEELSHSSNLKVDFMICRDRDSLAEIINKVKPGATISFVTNGKFSLHNLVIALAQRFMPAELHCTTFALREFPVRQLMIAMEMKIISSVKIVVDKRAKIRTPEVFALAQNAFCKIYQAEIHAKVSVLKTPDSYITIIGSQNWTTNPKIEAGVILVDDATGIFHKEWIEKLMNDEAIFK